MLFPTLAAMMALASSSVSASIFGQRHSLHRRLPPMDPVDAEKVRKETFEQLIDHDHPELGTFSQRYFYSDEFWAGPGSPIVLTTPGEVSASGYEFKTTNEAITGAFAEAIGGAVIVLEHRYWGESSPFKKLTTENLQHLTLRNSVADLTYFATHVSLPFDRNGSSTATKAPWVLSGGSYSGSLAAWTERLSPGTFWAYHASSAPVQVINDFWQYAEPIREGMPRNCSKDVSLVVDYVDAVLQYGGEGNKTALKQKFGLGSLKHDDDFVYNLFMNLAYWQHQDVSTVNSDFYKLCDYIENARPRSSDSGTNSTSANGTGTNSTSVPDENGVGLAKALSGFAAYAKKVMLPDTSCATYDNKSGTWNATCLGTHDPSSSAYTELSPNNTDNRQWDWMLCNEPFQWWRTGAPPSRPSIFSRLITPAFYQRQCRLAFPRSPAGATFNPSHSTAESLNALTGGWDARNSSRLLYVDGEFDPWKSATVSSEFRPGGPLQSTPEVPVLVVSGGNHVPDSLMSDARLDPATGKVVKQAIEQIKVWVDEWYAGKRLVRRSF